MDNFERACFPKDSAPLVQFRENKYNISLQNVVQWLLKYTVYTYLSFTLFEKLISTFHNFICCSFLAIKHVAQGLSIKTYKN